MTGARSTAKSPEALNEEAGRRKRRRRLRVAAEAAALFVAGAALYVVIDHRAARHAPASVPAPTSASQHLVLTIQLLGFGTPLSTAIGSGPCPQGRTQIAIVSATGAPIGSARLCVLTIEKTDVPNYGIKNIVQTVLETDSLPGGTLVSRQVQTIRFARNQRDTTAIFRGRILGGTGRYAHARGTISGGGPGTNGKANWRVTIRVHKVPATRRAALPQTATIVGTLRFSLREGLLFAARAGTLAVVVVPPRPAATVNVMRVAPGGAITRKRLAFNLSNYLFDVSAGRDGIYVGTAVVKRFKNVPDELLRIDSRTLTVRARASFPSRVAPIARDRELWASIGDGRVVRLDPRTLAIKASRQVVPAARIAAKSSVLKPALGLGSLWVLAGDALDLELVRMDPATLAVRSRTRIHPRPDLRQKLNGVVADSGHVYLVGSAIASVNARGKLNGPPVAVPDLATADIFGSGLVGLTSVPTALVRLDPRGRVLARTDLGDAGAELVVSGQNAWFLGNAGQGNGIVHVRLRSG